jgi:hypothetical protein
MEFRVPIVRFHHEIPAEAAGRNAKKYLSLVSLRVHLAHVRDLKGLLKIAELEDTCQALAGRHIAMKLDVNFKGLRVGVAEPLSNHSFMIASAPTPNPFPPKIHPQ